MQITAQIFGINYSPLTCRKLHTYDFTRLKEALSKEATFVLRVDEENKLTVSWWVSAKRTRSYPYARVYDSLSFSGKKVTIIPIIKDEGKDGDRDFLQWDTVSLMSLLGVYVIISYYRYASRNPRYENKITNQRFDISHIRNEITRLLSYQSDALHWNLSQLKKAGEIAEKALKAYAQTSRKFGVEMHSGESARKRVRTLLQGKEAFLKASRDLAKKAQEREVVTEQPKEKLVGTKAAITITNYLGGKYFFTSDEVELHGNKIHLIEGKHTKSNKLPSDGDIKDGLLRMILLTNLENVGVGEEKLTPIPILKLTTGSKFRPERVGRHKRKLLDSLIREAETNGFQVFINDSLLSRKHLQLS